MKTCFSNNKTICIDIDGVVVDFDNCNEGCNFTTIPPKWDKCPMRPGADKFVQRLKEFGYKIVFYTGRDEVDREPTEEWLKRHNIPFDELVMGKPRARIYIDDLGYRFDSFNKATGFILSNHITPLLVGRSGRK